MDAKERKIDQLEKLTAEQAATIEVLTKRIAELEIELAKLKKDSSNSSKPPSSDIVNPKKAAKKKRKRKRKQGAQKGHPKHTRQEFSAESLDSISEYSLESCPTCGSGLEDADRAPRVVQQVEIIDVPIQIEEHRGRAYWCPSCKKVHYAPLPPEVEQGQLFGPRLTTLVAYCMAHLIRDVKYLATLPDEDVKAYGEGQDRLPVTHQGKGRFAYADTGERCTVQEALFHYFGLPLEVVAEPAVWYGYHRTPRIVEASEDRTRILVRFTAESMSGESFGGTCLYVQREGTWAALKPRPAPRTPPAATFLRRFPATLGGFWPFCRLQSAKSPLSSCLRSSLKPRTQKVRGRGLLLAARGLW